MRQLTKSYESKPVPGRVDGCIHNQDLTANHVPGTTINPENFASHFKGISTVCHEIQRKGSQQTMKIKSTADR